MLPPVAPRKVRAGKRRDVTRRTRKDLLAAERRDLVASRRMDCIEDLSNCSAIWLSSEDLVRLRLVARVDNTLFRFVLPAWQGLFRNGGLVRFLTPLIILHSLKTCYRPGRAARRSLIGRTSAVTKMDFSTGTVRALGSRGM